MEVEEATTPTTEVKTPGQPSETAAGKRRRRNMFDVKPEGKCPLLSFYNSKFTLVLHPLSSSQTPFKILKKY